MNHTIKFGFSTSSVLLLLSSLLILTLLFDQKMISQYRDMSYTRLAYLQDFLSLQQQVIYHKQHYCQNLPTMPQTHHKIYLKGKSLIHHIHCQFHSIFIKLPTRKWVTGINEYINPHFASLFETKVRSNSAKNPQLLWLQPGETLSLPHSFYGVIVAPQHSIIEGEGKVFGVIIGDTSIDNIRVQSAWSRKVVHQLYYSLGQWHYTQRSWHDFTP